MAANLNQLPADGTQRLVIRPQKSKVITFSVVIAVNRIPGFAKGSLCFTIGWDVIFLTACAPTVYFTSPYT